MDNNQNNAKSFQVDLGSVTVEFQLTDEEFDVYAGEIQHSAFAGPLTIEVWNLVCQPVPEQLSLLRQALDKLSTQLPEIKKSVYRYFLDRRAASEEYGNAWCDEFDGIDNADECWASLEDCVMELDLGRIIKVVLELCVMEPITLSLHASMPWQCDGGFAVKFHDDGSWTLPDEHRDEDFEEY